MTPWKMIVEDFGKIKHAEIETAPFMLFVGDNNSGKSYLLSLLWGIRNIGITRLIGITNILQTEESYTLENWLTEQIQLVKKTGKHEVLLTEVHELLNSVLNDGLNRYKNKLAGWIFNSQDIPIGHVEIKIGDLSKEILHFQVEAEMLFMFTDEKYKISVPKSVYEGIEHPDAKDYKWFLIRAIYCCLLGIEFDDNGDDNIYLPAARTGFMLTKDIINKIGRKNTFNITDEKEDIVPFTRPINQFLDVMNDLTVEKKGADKYSGIAGDIEETMAEGTVEINMVPNKEVLYVPQGKKKGMPLRVVSAVVTELSPLILLLKHRQQLDSFYYEEPEMCLHPQLQQKMGRILGRIVNAGIKMTITTHSDIILQHINNMIKLAKHPQCEELCKKLGYGKSDLLDSGQIKVYQFESKNNRKTVVRELVCGDNGFVIPTFNDALDRIMDESYEIQEQ